MSRYLLAVTKLALMPKAEKVESGELRVEASVAEAYEAARRPKKRFGIRAALLAALAIPSGLWLLVNRKRPVAEPPIQKRPGYDCPSGFAPAAGGCVQDDETKDIAKTSPESREAFCVKNDGAFGSCADVSKDGTCTCR